jgi:hypothetical protein
VDNLVVFIILALIYGAVTLFKRLGQGGQAQRGEEGPEEPARPAAGGLEDIRRFLEEIAGPQQGAGPPSRPTPTQPEYREPSAPGLRAPGHPPTRRGAPAGAPSAAVQRPTPVQPTRAPGMVTAQSVAAAATRVRPLAGRLSEAKVKAALRTGDVSAEAEGLAKHAERLAAMTPRKLVTVAPAVQAEAYGTATRAPALGLLEAVQRLQQPLARAILYQEIIGLPLAIRGPERTFTDRVP